MFSKGYHSRYQTKDEQRWSQNEQITRYWKNYFLISNFGQNTHAKFKCNKLISICKSKLLVITAILSTKLSVKHIFSNVLYSKSKPLTSAVKKNTKQVFADTKKTMDCSVSNCVFE